METLKELQDAYERSYKIERRKYDFCQLKNKIIEDLNEIEKDMKSYKERGEKYHTDIFMDSYRYKESEYYEKAKIHSELKLDNYVYSSWLYNNGELRNEVEKNERNNFEKFMTPEFQAKLKKQTKREIIWPIVSMAAPLLFTLLGIVIAVIKYIIYGITGFYKNGPELMFILMGCGECIWMPIGYIFGLYLARKETVFTEEEEALYQKFKDGTLRDRMINETKRIANLTIDLKLLKHFVE